MQKKHLRKFNILLDKNTQQTGNRWELSQNNKGHVNDISIMAAQDIPPLIIKDIYKNPIANSILLFLAVPYGMQDLSSLTRDRTHTPCIGSMTS